MPLKKVIKSRYKKTIVNSFVKIGLAFSYLSISWGDGQVEEPSRLNAGTRLSCLLLFCLAQNSRHTYKSTNCTDTLSSILKLHNINNQNPLIIYGISLAGYILAHRESADNDTLHWQCAY